MSNDNFVQDKEAQLLAEEIVILFRNGKNQLIILTYSFMKCYVNTLKITMP